MCLNDHPTVAAQIATHEDKLREKTRFHMKIFIPMSDRTVDEQGVLSGELVPFNPEFLARDAVADQRRPRNWINDSDYASACRRLFGRASQELSLG